MNTIALQAFENRLQKMYKHRSKLARRQGISCYRVYDRDLNDFPYSIDLYENKIYVSAYKKTYDETDETMLQQSFEVIAQIFQLPIADIFMRERKRMDHRSNQYEKLNFEEAYFPVQENGLQFLVNLTDYLDTGLFLDHRITRKMVMEHAAGKRMLNLFCYTGSFSVYAAAGKAANVTSVDMSTTYLGWARKNFLLNNFRDEKKYCFIKADVQALLPTLSSGSYDLIIMDPPTFSNSKKMKGILDIQSDHVQLINQALHALTENGILFFSTNYRRFTLDSENIQSTHIRDITKQTIPFDFEGKLKRWCYKIGK